MALFPAYSKDTESVTQEDIDWDIAECSLQETVLGSPPSPGREYELLSDPRPATPPPPPPPVMDYYEDRKRDPANIPVSTIYYPGRPQYIPRKCDSISKSDRKRRKILRYYSKMSGDRGGGAEVGEARGARYRAAIDAGAGRETWLEYIHYLAYYLEDVQSAIQACEEAAQRDVEVTDAWHRLLQAKLTPAQYADRVKDMLDKEACPVRRVPLWVQRALALAGVGGVGGAGGAARGALCDVRRADHLYVNMLHVYGCILRNMGFWEEMVQLVELVLEVGGVKRGDLQPGLEEVKAEEELEQYEMKLISSGLPLGEVWRRIELGRGALHWRPLSASDPLVAADPQRAPSGYQAAEMLCPITDQMSWFRVCVWAVLSCEGILPGSHASCIAIFGTPYIWLAHVDTPAAVLQLIYSGRKLPGLSDDRINEVISILPARNYSKCQKDPSGFGRYVESVAPRCMVAGARGRGALLLLRLRAGVARARVLAIQGNHEEARRVISSCRLLIKNFGDNAPLPLAVLARAEHAASKNVHTLGENARGRSDRAEQLLKRALNAAILDDSVPECHALYISRVLSEVSSDASLCSWAALSAVLRRALPDDVTDPPSPELKHAALLRCEEKCSQLEEQLKDKIEPTIWETLTCSPIEWGAARVSLLSGEERARMLKKLASEEAREGGEGGEGGAGSYQEICACALLERASYQERRRFVNVFADRFPCNTYLAMMSAECTSWWDLQNPTVCEIRSGVRDLARVIYGVRGNGRGLRGLAKGLAAVGKGEPAILSALCSPPPSRWLALLPCPAPLQRADLLQASSLRQRALPQELLPF